MSNLITYDDKIRLKSQNVSEKYKVTAGDMNEIKSVVNTNVELVDEINKPENWVSVGTTAPTDGRRVWFEKGKNLFEPYKTNTTISKNGIDATRNDDGTITLNGTATANTFIEILYAFQSGSATQTNIVIPLENTKTYTLSINKISGTTTTNDIRIATQINKGDTNQVYAWINNPSQITNSIGLYRCFIRIATGVTVTNLIVGIQLEEGTSATTYEPYLEKSIKVDNEDFISMGDLVSVGVNQPSDGKRVWFAYSKNVLQHNAYDRTLNGVALKVNDDKSITLTGTASANTNFNIGTNSTITLKAGTYTFTKGATNVQLLIYYSSASVLANLPIGTSSQTITINSDTTYENYRAVISIPSGTQTNETVYPMLRLSTTSNTYEPYVEPSINVDNEQWYSKPIVLYQGSGSTTGTITLNDSVANYSCVDVVFCIDSFSENIRNYIRMEKYNTTQIFGNLISGQVDGGGNLRVWATRITISGTTATLDRDICLSLNTSGISSQTSRIKVVKVIGYK